MENLFKKISPEPIPRFIAKKAQSLGLSTFGDVIKYADKQQGLFVFGKEGVYFTSQNLGTHQRVGPITHKHIRGILCDILKTI